MTTTYLMDERLGFLALNRVSWIQLPVRGFTQAARDQLPVREPALFFALPLHSHVVLEPARMVVMMATMSVLLTYMLWALEGGKGQQHARTGTQTLDPPIKSVMLYRLSYPCSQTLSHLAATNLPITRSHYTLHLERPAR